MLSVGIFSWAEDKTDEPTEEMYEIIKILLNLRICFILPIMDTLEV